MTSKLESCRLEIRLVKLSGHEFVREGKEIHPWLRGHMESPAGRKKIERFKKLMLSGRWMDIRRACRKRVFLGGVPSSLATFSRKVPILVFLPDGTPWEGKHRLSALVELRGRIKPVEFACILGWPGDLSVDCNRYARSYSSRAYNFNALRRLVENGFKPAPLPPVEPGGCRRRKRNIPGFYPADR